MDDLREVKIDEANLDRELSEQAQHFLFAAEKSVAAEMAYMAYKVKVSELEAALDSEIRAKLAAEGVKATEKMIDAELKRTGSYSRAVEHLNKLYAQKELARSCRDAWHMRKDCLIQMAIKSRSELENMVAKVTAATVPAN